MNTPGILAVDVGNTTVALGLFREGRLSAEGRIPSDRTGELAEHWPVTLPRPEELHLGGVVGCSVNPAVACRVEEFLGRFGLALELYQRDIPIDIEVRVPQPHRVGADRLVNAREAFRRVGGAVLVVDFGTAVTLDCVSSGGAYLGGAIAPGVRLGVAALHERTALLPAVDLVAAPPPLAGETTAAIQSGVFWGTVGAVRELARRLLDEMPPLTRVIATGGDASLFAPHLPEVDEVAPNLTIEGLYRIYCDVHR